MSDESKNKGKEDKFHKRKKGESDSKYVRRITGMSASEFKAAGKLEDSLKRNAPKAHSKLVKKFRDKNIDLLRKDKDLKAVAKDMGVAGKLIERDEKKFTKSKASKKEKKKYEKDYMKSAKSDAEAQAMYGKEARRGRGYMRRPKDLKSGGAVYRGRSYAYGGRVAKYKG